MDNKDFVPYETAKKLKAAGFDEPCSERWVCEPDDVPSLCSSVFSFKNRELEGLDFTAPTLWQAAKWLREEKKMHCQVLLNGVRSMYFWQVRELVGNGKYADSTHQYDVYEDAMIDCIDAALELITNKTI